jgi:hypothetical protein
MYFNSVKSLIRAEPDHDLIIYKSESCFLRKQQLIPVLRIRDVYPGSRILIFTHPGSRIPDLGSRISDPGSKNSNKRERGTKLVVIPFYVATNFT